MFTEFTEGKQPCKIFKPVIEEHRDRRLYGQPVQYTCSCGKEIAWCQNCEKDHHAGGEGRCRENFERRKRFWRKFHSEHN